MQRPAGPHTLRYDAGASAYDRLTGRWSRMYVDRVLDAASVRSGSRVLDVATGTGDAALAAGERVGTTGAVIGVDISVPMLHEAQMKSTGQAIEFVAADAQDLPFDDATFDAAICLFGVMFFPDRAAALAGLRRLLIPGARFAMTAWATPEEVPFAGLVAQALGDELPTDRADLLRPFSLSDSNAIVTLLRDAGFRDVQATAEVRQSTFQSFDDDFWEPIEAGGGRLGQAYLGLKPEQRAAVRQRVLHRLPQAAGSDAFSLTHKAWVVVGTA